VPNEIRSGQTLTYELFITNNSKYALSGTQVRFQLPQGLASADPNSGHSTVQGDEIVVTLGHLAVGAEQTVEIPTLVPANARKQTLRARARVFSSTAQPVESNLVRTSVR
jgi:uncharacterized repeat protein (TIGR01451 family)